MADAPDRRFKLGRKKPLARQPMLRLSNYLLRTFPTPPLTVDYSVNAMGPLKDIYGNNLAGNCTCAAGYHIDAVMLANADQPVEFTDQDVLSFYMALSGWNGIADDPSDTGLTEYQVFNVWAQTGLQPGNHQITGFIELDPKDLGEIQASIWLFENIYRAGSLPQAWIDGMDTMRDGFTWDVAGPATEEGHAWMSYGYDQKGTFDDTWALLGRETYASIRTYGSTYSVLSSDSIIRASQRSPNGFNWTQLLSDFQSLGAVQI